MRINLTVKAGPHEGQVFEFKERATFIVGRSDRTHFRLPVKDNSISRVSARSCQPRRRPADRAPCNRPPDRPRSYFRRRYRRSSGLWPSHHAARLSGVLLSCRLSP
jgi:hypothetical protein